MVKSDIAVIIGQRIRARRLELGLSQDTASERADLHPTYIGQVERGEKNATIGSIQKICNALDIPMEDLFANIVKSESELRPAQQCYDLIISQPIKDQQMIYALLENIIKYKNN
jgi:transcriptional regulator with XRE-family HTH domain